MKARDLLVGMAIGVWLVTAFGHHAPAASSGQPTVSVSSPATASAPGPSVSPSPQAASPSPQVPSPSTAVPGQSATLVSPHDQGARPAISPIPAIPGSADWFIVVACAIAIAVSVSTVVFTAREIQLANKRPR
jgi:hypothetical protein